MGEDRSIGASSKATDLPFSLEVGRFQGVVDGAGSGAFLFEVGAGSSTRAPLAAAEAG